MSYLIYNFKNVDIRSKFQLIESLRLYLSMSDFKTLLSKVHLSVTCLLMIYTLKD